MITSTTNQVLFKFITDGSVTRVGFSASYVSFNVDNGAGETLTFIPLSATSQGQISVRLILVKSEKHGL